MSKELWIKIGLVGADPQFGTLQGRVVLESFPTTLLLENGNSEDDLGLLINDAIHLKVPFKLFDPIIFRTQRTADGLALGAAALAKSMPVIEGDFVTINPSLILWWAALVEDDNWNRVVASTISGIDLAGGGDLNIQPM